MPSSRLQLSYITDTEGTPAVPWQTVMDLLDLALDGIGAVAVTSADVTLTQAQSAYRVIKATGALTGNRALVLPATAAGERAFILWNATSGAYSLTIKPSGGAGVVAPQGKAVLLFSDGSTVTAVTVLAGSGSGLDADTLDGIDSAAFALLASPTFTGTPAAPTAAADANSTQLATTGFVAGQAGGASPAMNSAAAAGSSLRYARQDHVHPSDTSRAPLASPGLTGTPTAPTAAADANSTQLATAAYADGLTYPLVWNHLVNGSFEWAQRQVPGTLTTITDQKYGPDRWKCERENADLQYQRNTAASATLVSLYVGTLKKITNTGKWLCYQPLTAAASYALRGRIVTFQINLLATPNNQTIKIGILELGSGGTDDTIPAPLQTAWNANTVPPTWATNVTLLASASCAATAARATFNVSGMISSATRNVIVAVWSDSQFVANDTLQVREAALYVGGLARVWTPRPSALELALCRYFYGKSYAPATAPGTSTASGSVQWQTRTAAGSTTAATLRQSLGFGTPMRVSPTVLLYGTTGTSGAVRNLTASTDRGGATAASVCESGVGNIAVDNSSSNVIAADDALGLHWTADSEL